MSFHLSLEDGKFLVQLARRAVQEYLKTRKHLQAPENTPQKLLQPQGVFVTINCTENEKKELRGCIGFPYPTTPLTEAVIEAAINSATQDPRFPPMLPRELDDVVFEVSVLTPPQLIAVTKPSEYPAKIKVSQDGLIIERGVCKGLLLPQVPVEWEWDEETFLCQCCIKAGLPPDNWLMKDTKIYKFQAIVFEEQTPNGKITRKSLNVE